MLKAHGVQAGDEAFPVVQGFLAQDEFRNHLIDLSTDSSRLRGNGGAFFAGHGDCAGHQMGQTLLGVPGVDRVDIDLGLRQEEGHQVQGGGVPGHRRVGFQHGVLAPRVILERIGEGRLAIDHGVVFLFAEIVIDRAILGVTVVKEPAGQGDILAGSRDNAGQTDVRGLTLDVPGGFALIQRRIRNGDPLIAGADLLQLGGDGNERTGSGGVGAHFAVEHLGFQGGGVVGEEIGVDEPGFIPLVHLGQEVLHAGLGVAVMDLALVHIVVHHGLIRAIEGLAQVAHIAAGAEGILDNVLHCGEHVGPFVNGGRRFLAQLVQQVLPDHGTGIGAQVLVLPEENKAVIIAVVVFHRLVHVGVRGDEVVVSGGVGLQIVVEGDDLIVLNELGGVAGDVPAVENVRQIIACDHQVIRLGPVASGGNLLPVDVDADPLRQSDLPLVVGKVHAVRGSISGQNVEGQGLAAVQGIAGKVRAVGVLFRRHRGAGGGRGRGIFLGGLRRSGPAVSAASEGRRTQSSRQQKRKDTLFHVENLFQ